MMLEALMMRVFQKRTQVMHMGCSMAKCSACREVEIAPNFVY
jgi:hypothetical protein